MTLEDMLRAQRNHAMDAAAQLAVTVEQQKAEIVELKAALEDVPAAGHTGYFDMSESEFAAMEARQAAAQQATPEGLDQMSFSEVQRRFPVPQTTVEIPRQAAKVADGL